MFLIDTNVLIYHINKNIKDFQNTGLDIYNPFSGTGP